MTAACGLRAALIAVTVLATGGCSSLQKVVGPAPPTANTVAQHDQYRLELDAPDEVRKLLTQYMDLERFQKAPADDSIGDAELDRLMLAAPTQARGLLEAQGYFNAQVSATRVANGADPLPRLLVRVQPGRRATVSSLRLDVVGALQDEVQAGDRAAAGEVQALVALWPLRVGDGFQQAAWTQAKTLVLTRLRGDGYAAASWRVTSARVDTASQTVALSLELDSGPAFHVGAIQIDGLAHYDAEAVLKLANFSRGARYSEKLLVDFQDRLRKLGLFDGATVEIDADIEHAADAPVRVHLKEAPRQQATVGVGYSELTGPRLSTEHTNRQPFSQNWILRNKFELGTTQQSWEGDLSSHPLDNLYRNTVSGSATRLWADDQLLLSWNARLGRIQDTPRIERRYFVEITHARIDSAVLTNQADAASLNYQWVDRDIDNLLLPTRGLTTSTQLAVGGARGSQSVLNAPVQPEQGPFARLYTRLTWYQPLGNAWFGSARVEAGQVVVRSAIEMPDTLLFHAGGDDSVRGYAARTLGPTVDGVTTGGRSLLTTSVEVAHPISRNYPAYWWAAFVDAGNSADRIRELHLALGYGVGLRWRSPVGPLRMDLAYGQEVHHVRVHLSVGVTF